MGFFSLIALSTWSHSVRRSMDGFCDHSRYTLQHKMFFWFFLTISIHIEEMPSFIKSVRTLVSSDSLTNAIILTLLLIFDRGPAMVLYPGISILSTCCGLSHSEINAMSIFCSVITLSISFSFLRNPLPMFQLRTRFEWFLALEFLVFA